VAASLPELAGIVEQAPEEGAEDSPVPDVSTPTTTP